MTAKQKEILGFIRQYISTNGFPPSFREIADNYGINIRGAYDHACALQKKGAISWQKGKPRTIRILTA